MTLHEDKILFREAIEATAQHLKLRPLFVEKDYWVSHILRNLGLSRYADTVIFKGGTSLSKAYQCINRFSEDIDLAILSPGNYTGNQLKNLLKEVTENITQHLHIIEGHREEKKMGRMRATVYAYDKTIDSNDFGVVKDYILIEINCFADPVPHNTIPVSSYIAHFFVQTGNEQMIEQYNLTPTPVKVLSLERTYFEKVLSLNRLSYEGKAALQAKIRHFYDLHQLFHFPSLTGRLLEPTNFPLLVNILKNDQDNKAMHGAWQKQRIQDSPLFTELEPLWKDLTPTYQAGLETLIWTGKLPSPESVLTVLQATRTFIIAYDQQHPPHKH